MSKPKGAVFLALLVVLLGTAAPMPARAERVARTVKVVRDGVGAECRRLGWVPQDVCTAITGMEVSQARMAAYEQSWVHRALGLQRALDDSAPFLRELVPHTHNSFNSFAYPPTLTQGDSNQLYTMRDQLRMDMRGLEMDVHNWPHLDHPLSPSDDVVLCHGQEVTVGPVIVHLGCSLDRPFTDGLNELRGWLQEPASGNEVVLLYLENNLDNDVTAHNRAAADLAAVLGSYIYTPADHAAGNCAPMPMNLSRADVRAAGKRVLIVGNCGPGGWGAWVHERGPLWNESSSGVGENYPDYPSCAAERATEKYATHWIRRYEDSTWLSAMVEGTGQGGPSDVTVTETRRMVRCGVNMPGFDQLHPDDPRLAQLVWSWAPNEPAGAGSCAAQEADARFHARSCADPLPLACVDGAGVWTVAPVCGAGSHFAVPANGYENELLREAKATAAVPAVRVAYSNVPGRGWVPAG
jgi:hypothetical protein